MTNAAVRTGRTLTFLLLVSASAFAQEFDYEPGYIVTKSKDTIRGSVKYARRILPEIKFKPKTGKAQKYSPDDLFAFRAANRVFYSLRLPNNFLEASKGFLELVIDGPMKLYVYYYSVSGTGYMVTASGTGTPYPTNRSAKSYFLQKEGLNYLFTVESGKKFKEGVGGYLSEVSELSDKVKSGEYREKDIIAIVSEYNRLKQR